MFLEKGKVMDSLLNSAPVRSAVSQVNPANQKDKKDIPFILGFLEYRKGACSATSTGYWNDPDALDNT